MNDPPASARRKYPEIGVTRRHPDDLPDRRVDNRLPSLLHELLYYGLVERTGPGDWVLQDLVQEALEAQPAASFPADGHRVFIGLRCEACRSRTMTSLIGERRLCATCAAASATASPDLGAEDQAAMSTRGRRRRAVSHLRRVS